MIRCIMLVLTIVFLPLYPFFWVLCRLTAKPCPACGEKYFTSLQGEWTAEEWKCARCGHFWEVPFAWEKSGGK